MVLCTTTFPPHGSASYRVSLAAWQVRNQRSSRYLSIKQSYTFKIDQYILCLEIPVENPFLVTEIYSTENFFDYGFGLFLINGIVF